MGLRLYAVSRRGTGCFDRPGVRYVRRPLVRHRQLPRGREAPGGCCRAARRGLDRATRRAARPARKTHRPGQRGFAQWRHSGRGRRRARGRQGHRLERESIRLRRHAGRTEEDARRCTEQSSRRPDHLRRRCTCAVARAAAVRRARHSDRRLACRGPGRTGARHARGDERVDRSAGGRSRHGLGRHRAVRRPCGRGHLHRHQLRIAQSQGGCDGRHRACVQRLHPARGAGRRDLAQRRTDARGDARPAGALRQALDARSGDQRHLFRLRRPGTDAGGAAERSVEHALGG